MVVSWSMGARPEADLVNTMLDAAIARVSTSESGPIIHSDRGGRYRWPVWLARIKNARLTGSMSRKACSPDNAACEEFSGRLRTELLYPRSWQDISIDKFIKTVDAYISWYNNERIKLSLGSLPHGMPSQSWNHGMNQFKILSAPRDRNCVKRRRKSTLLSLKDSMFMQRLIGIYLACSAVL